MAASVAGAADPCPASPSQPATVVELSVADGQAANTQMLVSATLWLEMNKADAVHARNASEPCRIGMLRAADTEWELTGGDRAYPRRAVSSDATQPVAFLYPFADMTALLASAKAHAAPPPTRYALVTSRGSLSLVWRAYETLPSDAQLMSDLHNALTSGASAAASVDTLTEKVSIHMPGKAKGTVAPAGAPPTAADVTLQDPTDAERVKAFVATAVELGACAGRLAPATQAQAEALVAMDKLRLTPANEPRRSDIAAAMAAARNAGAEFARAHPKTATEAECKGVFERQIARLKALP